MGTDPPSCSASRRLNAAKSTSTSTVGEVRRMSCSTWRRRRKCVRRCRSGSTWPIALHATLSIITLTPADAMRGPPTPNSATLGSRWRISPAREAAAVPPDTSPATMNTLGTDGCGVWTSASGAFFTTRELPGGRVTGAKGVRALVDTLSPSPSRLRRAWPQARQRGDIDSHDCKLRLVRCGQGLRALEQQCLARLHGKHRSVKLGEQGDGLRTDRRQIKPRILLRTRRLDHNGATRHRAPSADRRICPFGSLDGKDHAVLEHHRLPDVLRGEGAGYGHP